MVTSSSWYSAKIRYICILEFWIYIVYSWIDIFFHACVLGGSNYEWQNGTRISLSCQNKDWQPRHISEEGFWHRAFEWF